MNKFKEDRMMKSLKKNITVIIVLVALISLLGLSIAQFFVLDQTLEANRLLFDQKIGLITQNITAAFREDRSLVNVLESALPDPAQRDARMEQFDKRFRKLADSVFEAYAVSIGYQYGIYSHIPDQEAFSKEWSSIEDPYFTFSACKNYAQANLTCGNGYSSGYHLAMVFPNQKLYLLTQGGKSIFISMAFIVMIVIGFVYTIVTIRRQKKLSDLKNDFINNLTHEFKTPVFSIGVALKTIRKTEEFNRSEKIQKYVEVIENENKRLKNQVDKILQLAMVQSGNFLLEKKPFNVHEALQQIVSSFRLSIEERGVQVSVQLNARQAWIRADETHLSNVFYNLMDNALKFTEHAPRIKISTFNDASDHLGICIGDNGVGISKEIEHFIFNKFFHGHSRPGVSGFGLGLYYARSVVESHHGRLEVKSEPGKGSEFFIYLPNHE